MKIVDHMGEMTRDVKVGGHLGSGFYFSGFLVSILDDVVKLMRKIRPL